ncbi:MAG TPA: hypothetical protein PLZ10_03230 [Chitinophagaceae bacterium]|nr:hypothetical protein [Chitinophagaceae bacterium]
MIRLLLSFFVLLITSFTGQSQLSRIHIVTIPNNQQMGFPIRFSINGHPFKLKNGQCLEWQVNADSVHIIMDDRRWVDIASGDLHLKAEADIYIRVFWGWRENEKKRIRLLGEVVCKSCFDEYKSKCKKELTE